MAVGEGGCCAVCDACACWGDQLCVSMLVIRWEEAWPADVSHVCQSEAGTVQKTCACFGYGFLCVSEMHQETRKG